MQQIKNRNNLKERKKERKCHFALQQKKAARSARSKHFPSPPAPALPQVHGHYPPASAATLLRGDQGCHRGDLGLGSASRLPAVFLLHRRRTARTRRVLPRMARIQDMEFQTDVSILRLSKREICFFAILFHRNRIKTHRPI